MPRVSDLQLSQSALHANGSGRQVHSPQVRRDATGQRSEIRALPDAQKPPVVQECENSSMWVHGGHRVAPIGRASGLNGRLASSAMRISWLYLASRSPERSDPTL